MPHPLLTQQDLVKRLTVLLGLTPAKVADASNIRRPNLYSWLKGKPQALSEQFIANMMRELGVEHGQLSYKMVHRWYVCQSIEEVRLVLEHSVDRRLLETAYIYFMDCGREHRCNLMMIPRDRGEPLALLVSCADNSEGGYPLNAARLGFGIDKGKVEIPDSTWKGWWEAPTLPSRKFWIAAKPLLSELMEIASPDVTPENLIDIRTEYERQIAALTQENIEQTATNAGLRAIIRALLVELRRLDPNSALLDHARRDEDFAEYFVQELEKLEKANQDRTD